MIAITSRRENLTLFKGEELQFKGMNEMDFEEFLWAKNEKALAELIRESFTKHKTCPFHWLADFPHHTIIFPARHTCKVMRLRHINHATFDRFIKRGFFIA